MTKIGNSMNIKENVFRILEFLVQANLNDLFAVPSSSSDQIEVGALARAYECDYINEEIFFISWKLIPLSANPTEW